MDMERIRCHNADRAVRILIGAEEVSEIDESTVIRMVYGIHKLFNAGGILSKKSVILAHRADALLLRVLCDFSHSLRNLRKKAVKAASELDIGRKTAGNVVSEQLHAELRRRIDKAADALYFLASIVASPIYNIGSDKESNGLDSLLGTVLTDLLRSFGIQPLLLPSSLDKFYTVKSLGSCVIDASEHTEL